METNKKLFVGGLANLLKEEWQVDVQLKGRDSDEMGSVVYAHKLIMSSKSKVFKQMLDSDQIKTSADLETITFCEMKHEELEALIDFIYSDGSALSAKMITHVRSLYQAADKYEIPHLRDLCRYELLSSLNPSNALSVIVLAQIPYDRTLDEAAFYCTVNNMSTIVSSDEFNLFNVNHPNLAMQIMKAFTAEARLCSTCGSKCYCGVCCE